MTAPRPFLELVQQTVHTPTPKDVTEAAETLRAWSRKSPERIVNFVADAREAARTALERSHGKLAYASVRHAIRCLETFHKARLV